MDDQGAARRQASEPQRVDVAVEVELEGEASSENAGNYREWPETRRDCSRRRAVVVAQPSAETRPALNGSERGIVVAG